jgi:hypothetical protein
MIWRRGVGHGVWGLALAGLLIFCGALAGVPAQAFEPPPGSKNFATPGSVPNYFSDEAAPFDRGSHVAQPGADRFNTAPIAASRRDVSISEPRRTAASSAAHRSHRVRFAASRSGRSHAGHTRGRPALVRLSAKTASRHSVATKHRAAASRSRYAARGATHASRSFR